MPNKLRRPPEDTPVLYSQEELGEDAIVYAHYYLPGTLADWYVTEYDPEEDIAFGWAELIEGCGEWGYTSLAELEKIIFEIPVYFDDALKLELPGLVEFEFGWVKRTMREVLAKR